jgi:hypothetical protein
VQEVTDVLVSVDLLLEVWDWNVLWIIAVEPRSPGIIYLGLILHSFNNTAEEFSSFIGKTVVAKSFKVEPGLLIEPADQLLFIINTSTSLEED